MRPETGVVGRARLRPTAAGSRTASSSPSTRACRCSPPGCCARTAARSRSTPDDLRREVADSLRRVRAPPRGRAVEARPRGRRAARPEATAERSSGPVTPERFGLLQALLAYLLAACGEDKDAVDPGRRDRRALPDPVRGARGSPLPAQPRQLRRRLLRGLRRAARRRGARRQGALGRHLPLRAAADAARGARDPARARVRRAADRRRGAPPARPRAQEARGDLRRVRALPDARSRTSDKRRGGPRRDADRRDPPPPARRDRVPEGGGGHADRRTSSSPTRSSGGSRTGTCTRGTARATTSAASGSTGCAARRSPTRSSSRARASSPASSSGALVARVLYSPAVARWEVERGARAADRRLGDQRAEGRQPRVAVGEILRYRGEAELLEPPELRREIAEARADARARARRHRALRAPACGVARLADERQLERERRALAGRRAHLQRAAVRLRDRARDEEPEARCPGLPPPTFARPNFSKIRPCCSRGMPGPAGPRPRPARGRSPPTRGRPPLRRPAST